jgi:OPA family glycerol-3-phosphate transporter-like MFS transporter
MEFMSSLNNDQQAKFKRWRYRVFASTWLTYAGFYFCRQPYFVVKKSLADSMTLDPVLLSNIGTAYLLAYAVGQFINGNLGKRFGSRILVLTGLGLTLLSNIVFGTTNSYLTICLFMVVNGFAQSSGWPGTVGNMAFWFHRKERGTVMGFWSTCYQLGGVGAKALAALLLGKWGFKSSFFGGACIVLLVWIIVLIIQRNRPEDVGLPAIQDENGHESENKGSHRHDNGWTRQVYITVFMLGMVYFCIKFLRYAFWSWTPYFLSDSFGLTGEHAGYLSTLFDVGGFLGVIFAGIISDRIFKGRRNQIAFLMAVGFVLGCLYLWYLGPVSVLFFTIGTFFIGFMLYGPDSLASCTGAIDVGSASGAALAAGIINGVGSLGPVCQEKVIGYLLKTSIDTSGKANLGSVFSLLLIVAVLASIFLGILLYRARQGKSKF